MESQPGKSRLTRRALSMGMPTAQEQESRTGEEPTQPAATVKPAPIFRQPGVVRVRSLHVRNDHSMNAETVASLKSGDAVIVLGTWTDGRDTWARIGDGRWAVMTFNSQTYIELI